MRRNMQPQPELRIELLLEDVIRKRASDCALQIGLPPMLRVDGSLMPIPWVQRTQSNPKARLCYPRRGPAADLARDKGI